MLSDMYINQLKDLFKSSGFSSAISDNLIQQICESTLTDSYMPTFIDGWKILRLLEAEKEVTRIENVEKWMLLSESIQKLSLPEGTMSAPDTVVMLLSVQDTMGEYLWMRQALFDRIVENRKMFGAVRDLTFLFDELFSKESGESVRSKAIFTYLQSPKRVYDLLGLGQMTEIYARLLSTSLLKEPMGADGSEIYARLGINYLLKRPIDADIVQMDTCVAHCDKKFLPKFLAYENGQRTQRVHHDDRDIAALLTPLSKDTWAERLWQFYKRLDILLQIKDPDQFKKNLQSGATMDFFRQAHEQFQRLQAEIKKQGGYLKAPQLAQYATLYPFFLLMTQSVYRQGEKLGMKMPADFIVMSPVAGLSNIIAAIATSDYMWPCLNLLTHANQIFFQWMKRDLKETFLSPDNYTPFALNRLMTFQPVFEMLLPIFPELPRELQVQYIREHSFKKKKQA